MKRLILLICICILFLLTTSCGTKLNGYTELSYEEFTKKKENGDTFPLVIGSSTCSACATYKVVMEKIIEDYQVEVFYVDLSKISEEEYNKLKIETSFTGTPTTVFYEAGKLTSYFNRIDEAVSIDKIKKFLEENNYIG